MLSVHMPDKTIAQKSADFGETTAESLLASVDVTDATAEAWRSEDIVGQLFCIYSGDCLELPADLNQLILEGLRNDAKIVQGAADAWLDACDHWLADLPKGKVIVVDLLTGDYVSASTRLLALVAFKKQFGQGKTVGWLHEVGGGAVLGGGVA